MNSEYLNKLKEIQIQLDLLKAEDIGPCDCDDHLEIRIRSFGGGIHYVRQCYVCGEQRGGSLKKADAIRLLSNTTPKDFDLEVNDKFSAKRKHLWGEISRLSNEEFSLKHLINGQADGNSSHLEMMEKHEKAASDLARGVDDLVIQLGLKRTVGLLVQETIRLNKRAHAELKENTKRFSSEPELKTWFEQMFSGDFEIYSEVSGRHLAEDVDVRIDYFLKARRHLVEQGFDQRPFGVEVKYFKQEEKFTHRTSRGLWQTISYNDCEFYLHESTLKPKFCLIFSNLSFQDELKIVNNFGSEYENDNIQWRGMLHLANHANVGCLNIKGSRDNYYGWEIRFVGGTYFSCNISKETVRYNKSNENVINKVRVGNF